MASKARSDGEGSIYYDEARERWVGAMVVGWVGVAPNQKPIRRKVSAASRAGAATKLRELRDKVEAGDLPKGRVPTVEEWLTYWLEQVAAKKVRDTTLPSYRSKVNGYLIPLLGRHRLDRLTPEHIEAAWRELTDVRGLSTTTAHQSHRILARALKVATQRGLVKQNVATLVDAPQPVDQEMTPLSVKEAKRVLATAEGQRNSARWSVALSLGLRQGEALGLTWDDVDLKKGTIRVRLGLARIKGQGLVLRPVKSRKSKRTIVMPDQLLAEMKAHRKAQREERLVAGSWWDERNFVFPNPEGRPMDPSRDWAAWRDLLIAAKVDHRRLHDARHTAATMLLAQGVAPRIVMEILGHSQISVTSKYQHVVDEMQRDAMKRQGDALWGG